MTGLRCDGEVLLDLALGAQDLQYSGALLDVLDLWGKWGTGGFV